MSTRSRHACLVALLVTLTGVRGAGATTASISGPGPRAQALAGAGATLDLGYEAAFQNPAALAFAEQPALSLGYGVTDTRLYLQRGSEVEERFDTDQLQLTLLGFVLPLRLGEQQLVLGMASVSPSGFVARADLPLAEQPQFPLLVSRRQAIDVDLGLGIRPWRFLALGVGVRALSTLSGSAAVERVDGRSVTRVDDVLEPVLAPHAGVSAFFGESETFSVVWRAPLRADFDVELAAVDLDATQLPALNLAGVAHYDPLSLGAEYAHHFDDWSALFGVVYQRYSDAPALLPRTVDCPQDRPDCLALAGHSPKFEDTFDLHVAARYGLELTAVARAELRVGYAYLPSPLPEQRGAENLLDSARHRLALGYGLTLSKPLPELGLDLALQIDRLVSRTHRKSNDIDSGNAGAPELTARGHVATASLALTLRLK
jgi:long-subunit fatty acid transport protein